MSTSLIVGCTGDELWSSAFRPRLEDTSDSNQHTMLWRNFRSIQLALGVKGIFGRRS